MNSLSLTGDVFQSICFIFHTIHSLMDNWEFGILNSYTI